MARESGITGTVYITFVVEKDGSLSDIRALREVGGGCTAEALRVIQTMPRWTPGKQRGVPVRVRINLPVKFMLL
jgi:protein TonB